ncbi:hypothetical protein INT47_009368 [Mucor saturninus]|uniref:Uncharacterized protein n=1 Tax=Mucor saturninus TaxID=64648 RepID=A0A8H7R4L6_9FUNG|nr:hypothetical protein INT47_009368 [Mucor saturninus]
MNVEIVKLLDHLRPHAMKVDAYQLRTQIDELKYKKSDQRSAKYQLLNVVVIIYCGFKFWKTSASKSEFSYP